MARGTGQPPLELVHRCDGRVRLKAVHRGDSAALRAAAERVAALPAVLRVVSRPATGSIIVDTERGRGTRETLRALRAEGLVGRTVPRHAPSLRTVAQANAARLDAALRFETDGALDGRTLLALVLIVGAVVQAMRGQLSGPSTALVLGAYSLLSDGANGDGADATGD